jgi:hypothetical protein
MSWGLWLGISWLVLGVTIVAASEIATRRSGTQGLIFDEDLVTLAGVCAAIIIGAPLVVLFCIGVCAQIFWQGRVPITDQVWWRARAKMFDDSESGGLKSEPLPRTFLRVHIGTWNGANFIAPDGSLVLSRLYQIAEMLSHLRALNCYDGDVNRENFGDPYAPDFWADLEVLKPGDQVWGYQRGSWAGRALVREGQIVRYTEDTHFQFAPKSRPDQRRSGRGHLKLVKDEE